MADLHLRLGKDMLVVEGPLGPLLERQGLPAGESLEELSLLDPELVSSVHRLYASSGTQCLLTNTRGCLRSALDDAGVDAPVADLVHAASQCAQEAKPQHLLGVMGPSPVFRSGEGAWSEEEDELEENGHDRRWNQAATEYRELADALAQEPIDAFLIQGIGDIEEALCALSVTAPHQIITILALSLTPEGYLSGSGQALEDAILILDALGVDIIGIDAGVPAAFLPALLSRCQTVSSKPLFVLVDAEEGDGIRKSTDIAAEVAEELMAAGAQFIGPGNGGTPAHAGAIWSIISGKDVARS